ncbi:MAG: lytic transglycosylase domain-containing protein [Woeseiaceae bacterium]
MQSRLEKAAYVAVVIFVLLLVSDSDASMRNDELDAAWANYSATRTQIQPAYRFPHASCFAAAASQYDLPVTLLLAVARGESDFEVTARSKANAHGVMQILWPGTAKHLGIHRLSELYEPCTNIDAGARYLRELLGLYDDNLHLALAAYNYGPGRISVDGDNIPQGATWYSGYIYRHLDYVLGDGAPAAPSGEALYSDIGQSTLLTFAEPYRAEAFIARLETGSEDLRLDWFRRGVGEFEVVMTYADREQFERGATTLRRMGFRVD